jgi:DNA polymerase-4/DNA polymerase V
MEDKNSYNKFPRAILHVDGDAFFVACEVACNPALRGKPVVTGADRKIASALSYEAKALGVSRGMPVYEIRKVFPQVIVIPSHYRLYEIFSQRMYRIISRFTSVVEWYSIDECFADITGLDVELGISYEEIAGLIKRTLFDELGITFSVGLSSTKVLAKVASKFNKPDGLTCIPVSAISAHLKETPLGKIWGIGPQTNAFLARFGIQTAHDFAIKEPEWVRENCAKQTQEIWHELSGRSILNIHSGKTSKHKSLSSTETFMPTSADPTFLFSELSRHVEDVSRSARVEGLAATRVSFFLKTKDFRYHRIECILPGPTATPHEIISAVQKSFGAIFRPGVVYRASGVTLFGLVSISHVTQDLFGSSETSVGKDKSTVAKKIYDVVDQVVSRHGTRAIHMCSSLLAVGRKAKRERGFSIPVLGKVS